MKRRSAASVPPAPWRPLLRWVALLLVVATLALYSQYRRQLHRHVRRTWASLVSSRLTGREKSPLLAGYTVHGIDVSSYQGRIDWAEVSRNHVKFAFIKASEGVTLRDSRFQRNWNAARKAGVYCGAYHYFQPTYDGARQANLFTRTVPLAPGDLPPVLDVEHTEFHDVAVMRRNVAVWLRLVERHYGVRPILYSNYSFYKRYLAGHFDKYPLWLAHYEVEQPRLPRDKWIIWQHSDESYIPGIRGTVDFNVFQGSFQSLLSLRIPEKEAATGTAK
ncbi:glycoside hydrolase family 25 protein [Hymenobacter tibetensis]|uniref:Glycoside hydrolase family 25 protein n=1 Tax=Hymenobacter tibetensis TaxID=497967 RepID=A0ABY4D006_9BACT|nr:glycoside hydrolase family 25 protein [Hymenobacter tibetensis]UOG74775.1 glycoside hydrolase family 25 protein [Hymenobacter tibetensis]